MFGRRPAATNAANAGPARSSDMAPSGGLGNVVGDFQSLWEPTDIASTRKSVEALLLERGHITEEQLDQARKVSAQTPGKTLPQILATMNAATESQLLSAIAETLGVPFETPEKSLIDPEAFELLPLDYVRKNLV